MAEKLSSEEIKKCIEQAEATARSANVNPAKRGADGARSRVDSAHVGAELIVQCAADITPEPVEWLWPGRVALGKLALIGGEPGLGKSQVAIEIVTAVTTGGELPCGEGRAPQGNVVILSAEDGVADTIVPRLMATGADRNRMHIISAVKDRPGGAASTYRLTLSCWSKRSPALATCGSSSSTRSAATSDRRSIVTSTLRYAPCWSP